MNINLEPLSANKIYHLMTQTVVPRPIAWVLTNSAEADATPSYNLAPFSYFNAVCSAPPLLMFSVGKKPDGSDKDTTVNIRNTKKMVIHIPSDHLANEVTESAATLPHGESELNLTKLTLTDFDGFSLPRLTDCDVAFACSLYDVKYIGDVPQTLIFAKVEKVYINDEVTELDDKGRVSVKADKIRPLARLGANEYALFGDINKKNRPK